METDATEIEVALPPDPLGESWYELWTKGGCERRCDGETVTLARGAGPDGAEPVEQPCLCAARGELVCKRTTRLSVLLPDVRFLGCWRLDTKGENAAEELPGMVAMVQAMQGRGITKAVLRLDQRKSGRNEFVVPMLGLDATVNELAAGDGRLGLQDGTAPTPVLEAACPGCVSPYSMHREGCQYRPFDTGETGVIDVDELVDTGGAAVIGEDILTRRPIDEALTRAWLESLSNAQKAKALLVGNRLAREQGWDPPQRFQDISLELADLVEETMRKEET